MDIIDSWFQSVRGGNLKEAISIFKNNPDIINTFTTIDDGRIHYQTNAIIEASFQGNRDLVKWLIENNADVNSVSDGGWRPIHYAAQHGHVTTVNLLVLGGAEVNVKTETNETPILLALQAYMRDTVKKLMYHGASLIGIDRSYLHMWIQKDVLDPACLDEENKSYLAENNYNKSDLNGYDIMIRQTEREVEEIKVVKLAKGRLVTDYDNDLRHRRQELVKKMRRVNDLPGTITGLIRKVALSDSDGERLEFTKEALLLVETQETQMPQTKTLDHSINLLELCICDSDSSEEFIRLASKLMMHILQHNARRGELAVVDFWCRIFDKMSNLQIEQYTMKILEMLTHMIELASDTVISNFRNIKDTFLKTWEYFFENLGFPRCLSTSLKILKLVHGLVPESVNHRFHNVIDIMIGWCIHPDTDIATLETIRARSADLHDCWISDVVNLKKTIANLEKDVITHCQILSRIHRLDKDRPQVDELRTKIRYFCFALSCVTAGISGIADTSNLARLLENKVEQPLPIILITTVIEKLCESMIICSKQIDFDNLLLQSNTVILHLLSCIDKHELTLTNTYTAVLRYIFGMTLPLQSRTITEGSSNINYNTTQLLASNLDLIHICCTHSSLEPSMVIQIFSPANWIHSCLFYGSTLNKELMRRLLRTVNVIIQSPVMSTFYQILLSDLELSINTLLKLSGSLKQVHLVQSNAFKNKTYDSDQAELVVKYNINMMLLVHRQLKAPTVSLVPSIAVLFQKYLAFYEPTMIEKYPITSLFILESINSISIDPITIYELIKYNCYYLKTRSLDLNSREKIFGILQKTLASYDYNCDKKDKIVNMVVKTMANLATLIIDDSNDNIVMACVSTVLSLIRTHRSIIDPSIKNLARNMAIKYTVHTRTDIRMASFNLYYNLIDGIVVSDSVNDDIRSLQSISLRGRSFKFPLDFSKTIFNWIIHSCDETSFGNSDTMRLYDLVVTVDSGQTGSQFKNRMIVLYEIMINACWDCVRQKLKFDQNADSRITLMTIENIVKYILTNGNSLKTIADKRFRKLMSKFATKAVIDQMLSINLIILLLDVLEKMFYNSYEGCSVGMPPVNKTTENFFVTNKHVCSEWFIKMRLMIVAMAQYAGQWSTVVWHGMQLLTHHLDREDIISESATRALFPEMEDCIVFTSMALSKLGNWETLLGLSRMTVRIYGNKFDWIEALADKTIGHIELALTKFEDYIRTHHDPERMKQSPELRLLTRKPAGHSSFILCMEEIADCNRLLANVDGLEKWAKQMTQWKSDTTMLEAQKSSINWSRLSCLAKLSKWDNCIDDQCTPLQQSEFSWKYRSVTDHCEDILFTSAINQSVDKLSHLETLSTQLASLQSVCDFPMALSSPDLILINERSKCLRLANDSQPIVIDTKTLSAFTPTLPLSVINFCNVLQKSYKREDCFANQKYLIQWHRNLCNFKKSESLIDQCFKNFLDQELQQQKKSVSLSHSKSPIIQMQLERQSMQLLWATDEKRGALELLTNSLKEGLLFETSDQVIHATKCRINTKSLLTLFQWLSNDKTVFSLCADNGVISNNLQFLTELAEVPWINGLPLVSPQQRSQTDKLCHSSVTDVCGQLLILASKSKNQDNNDKSFMTLAQWCLSRSRSLDEGGFTGHDLDDLVLELTKDSTTNYQLSPDNIHHITQLFTTSFQPAKMQTENDWLGLCYDDVAFLDEMKSSIITLCPDLEDPIIVKILSLWKTHICNHFSLHIAASDAYFSFLKDAKPQQTADSVCIKNQTTANLRILSLLGKRSRSLRDAIIVKMRTSPPVSWVNVIPQLFARIKHPDTAIRTSVTELLQRFALCEGNRSKLIIYPTIVGTMNEDHHSLTSPCHEIRKVLSDNNEALVYEVEVFIRELRRITVLWDELWIASLNQCYEELTKKTSQLQSEIERITKDDEAQEHLDIILQLKYNSIIQPALFILERVKAATDVTPETPRESWFHNTFNEEINSTINAIKSPVNIYEFKDCWKKVKELQELMITESNDNSKIRVKRSRHQFLSLKLNEISPSLAKISKSHIPIPGMEDIELVSIDSHISILPTKTKPKKLQFVASNGKKYHYLYKGLEDLRLDERIMQILGIANTMFSKLNERESNKYHITTYSVTPLGPRAGLIQMVEDATSLFTLYKRHQMRTKNTADLSKSRYKTIANADTNEATVVSEEGNLVRPTDIYWQKLRPKLEMAKLDSGFENRDKWPSSILIEVLNELKRETPSDLLSKELWCCSINSHNWFRSSIGFTRSCAVMSIMGYILGLGDRHLDNLLVDLSTGQIIHIDYNVCFDKGAALKVPEKVPFRLTDIITDVFGPAGVDGLFKISCENVMDMIQQSQDSILTLMDTFVLDPIVDWSSGIESGHYGSFEGGKFAVNSMRSVIEKRCVEFIIGLNNFQSVLVTMEDELKNSNDNLLNELNGLYTNVERNLEICAKIREVEQLNEKKGEMIEYLDRYVKSGEQCDIIEQVNYVKSIESRSMNINVDLERRLKQMNQAIAEHGNFFNMILSNTDFISFKLDTKNLVPFFSDNVGNIDRSISTFLEVVGDQDGSDRRDYMAIMDNMKLLVSDVELLQGCSVLFEKYRTLLLEMPESYYVSDRCSHMSHITRDLINERCADNFSVQIDNYSSRWVADTPDQVIVALTNEKNNWSTIFIEHSKQVSSIQGQIVAPSNDEEIQQLEHIWQLTMYEPGGINVFKAVLLEQYLEMATIASQIDTSVAKIPDQVSLTIDYNETLRKYLQLLNAHENYFKILSNCMNVFSMYLNVTEAAVVCSMMASLHKVCLSVSSFESNFIEIIMPESIKIMKNVSPEDEELLGELQSIVKDTDNILLHFNIALTSSTYDINNYDAIHSKTVVPIKERMARLTDIKDMSVHDSSKQLRVLIASFYTTINQTYQLVCDFIDCCISSSTPSAWTYLDLVAASGLNISPMWTKSHQLLKDAVYMTSLRSLITTLDHCRLISTTLQSQHSIDHLNNLFANMLRQVEIYFNFINRHILAGVGSQCFGKMFCLLLEFAGWNLDAIIAESIPNCAISADYICGSVSSFRKTEYPNAANFYKQLQFRFNSYKTLTGFTVESNVSLRFLSRNIGFHKSLCNLARNQLVSMCWIRKDVLQLEASDVGGELSLVKDTHDLLTGIVSKLDMSRDVLSRLESLDHSLLEVDTRISDSWITGDEEEETTRWREAQKKMVTERNNALTSVRKRIMAVNNAMVNIDRFECLRYRSERGHDFDEEILQFLGDTKHLLQELGQCSSLISPIEEDIVKCKEEAAINDDVWWLQLRDLLTTEMTRGAAEHREQGHILGEIMGLYDQEVRHWTTVLADYYYPIISQLKPTLRTLYSITRKLRAYLSGNDLPLTNLATIKSRLAAVCALMNLFEQFNAAIEAVAVNGDTDSVCPLGGVATATSTTTTIADTAERLTTHIGHIGNLRNIIIPELFAVFKCLSPLATASGCLDDDGSDVSAMYGFSNNNMAESNGDHSMVGRLSSPPLQSLCAPLPEEEIVSGTTATIIGDKDTYNGDLKKYVHNSAGVQRAVDVWRLVEARVKRPECQSLADPERSKQAITQYVDKCIRSARNPDNLARMYEGWTAWV